MGWHAHTEYAEDFVRAQPEVLRSIVVPKSALLRASEPCEKRMKRMSVLPRPLPSS